MSCKKKCPNCSSFHTKKNGKRNRRQCYKCLDCKHSWGGKKSKSDEWIGMAYRKYASCRHTLKDLSELYGKSTKTLRALFDANHFITGEIKTHSDPSVVVMDATYFRRGDGVLVARSNKRNIAWLDIKSEKTKDYHSLINLLVDSGVQISCFVIDGRRGVLQMLQNNYPHTPVQLCQFHQTQIITRYLSKKPKLEAGRQLRKITLDLKHCSKRRFTRKLRKWHRRWNEFLDEKTPDESKRGWHYTHRRLRSAYRSLKNNLPWLFTYLRHSQLNIPNTTNSCDGYFSHLKNKISTHRGMRKDRKRKMIHYLLENS